MAVFAENGTEKLLRLKFQLRPNFGFLKAISYGFGVSEKNPFRSHTTSGQKNLLNCSHTVCPPARPGLSTSPQTRLRASCSSGSRIGGRPSLSRTLPTGRRASASVNLTAYASSTPMQRELPDMMFAKFPDILTPSLSAFGSDLYYKIHATSLTTSACPWPPPPSDADITSGSSQRIRTQPPQLKAPVKTTNTNPDDTTTTASAAVPSTNTCMVFFRVLFSYFFP